MIKMTATINKNKNLIKMTAQFSPTKLQKNKKNNQIIIFLKIHVDPLNSNDYQRQ